jgi:hypothetical protein
MMKSIEDTQTQGGKCDYQKCTKKMMYPNESRPDYSQQPKPQKQVSEK